MTKHTQSYMDILTFWCWIRINSFQNISKHIKRRNLAFARKRSFSHFFRHSRYFENFSAKIWSKKVLKAIFLIGSTSSIQPCMNGFNKKFAPFLHFRHLIFICTESAEMSKSHRNEYEPQEWVTTTEMSNNHRNGRCCLFHNGI